MGEEFQKTRKQAEADFVHLLRDHYALAQKHLTSVMSLNTGTTEALLAMAPEMVKAEHKRLDDGMNTNLEKLRGKLNQRKRQ